MLSNLNMLSNLIGRYNVYPNGSNSTVIFIENIWDMSDNSGFEIVYKDVLGNSDFIMDKKTVNGKLLGQIGYSTLAKLLSQVNGPVMDLF